MTSTAIGSAFFIMSTSILDAVFHWGGNHPAPPPAMENARLGPRTPAALADLVVDLPGLNFDPGFDQFAGYLSPTRTRHIFYWYVESQNDPENDPVVLWTNGGPGCSGLLGFGTEHGPFYIGKYGNLHANPYSWNKNANMLYIEQPAGVGFSYFDRDIDMITGDSQAAADNFRLVQEFMLRFPERATNSFYIASESYGGHYMPQLALQLLRMDLQHRINFKGFMVGNPYVDPYTNMMTQFEAYYSHGLLAKPLFDQWSDACRDPDTYQSKECDRLASELFKEFGHGINPYALDYPVCTAVAMQMDSVETIQYMRTAKRKNKKYAKPMYDRAVVTLEAEQGDEEVEQTTSSSQVNMLLNHTIGNDPPFLPSQDNYKPCSQVYLETYLNRHDVRTALHVLDVATYKWSPCGGVKYAVADVGVPVIALYKELIKEAVAGSHDLSILVFSGDDDSICSTPGTQQWIWKLGVEPSRMWKPWKVESQTAGFLTEFDLGPESSASFYFATVHGAGHEVPAYRPMEALALFQQYLSGNWSKEYYY